MASSPPDVSAEDDMLTLLRCVREISASLPMPKPALLASAKHAPTTAASHRHFTSAVPAFSSIEVLPPPAATTLPATIRVAAWNAERLKYQESSAALVGAQAPDVVLLTETDVGMARSGNRHTTADLAAALGMGYVFGVEFLELSLGDDRERLWHVGSVNAVGLHGNAILSRFPLRDVTLIRLDEGGVWWIDAQDDQRRLGWRMAMAGRIETARGPIFAACVHLESKSDAADRSAQIRCLLDEVETLAIGDPVILGGDFNTNALSVDGRSWTHESTASEPLFALLAEAGFDWQACNTDEVTLRTRPDGTPVPPFRRIDWFFTRGLSASDPVTVPAVDAANVAVSDHDLIRIDVSRC